MRCETPSPFVVVVPPAAVAGCFAGNVIVVKSAGSELKREEKCWGGALTPHLFYYFRVQLYLYCGEKRRRMVEVRKKKLKCELAL